MLRLYLHLQMDEMPEGVVSTRWYSHDSNYVAEQKRQLLRTIPTMGSDKNERKMSRAERYNYLLAESKAMVEIAATSEEGMDILVQHLDNAKLEINKLQLPDDLEETHSLDPRLFPSNVLNPGLPIGVGRLQTKRKNNCGKARSNQLSTKKTKK